MGRWLEPTSSPTVHSALSAKDGCAKDTSVRFVIAGVSRHVTLSVCLLDRLLVPLYQHFFRHIYVSFIPHTPIQSPPPRFQVS